MKRTVTVHRVADRHSELHGRSFGETRTATVWGINVAAAVVHALRELGLGDERGKTIITVDWPHE